MKTIILENDQATFKLGRSIGNIILKAKQKSIEIHLEGDLGAGKTFLTKSVVQSCGWTKHVKSPTYTLCEEYDLGDLIFLHIDLYRTDEHNDILLFNLDRDTHPKKVVIIEWADKLKNNRNCDLKIVFKHINKAREISITTSGNLFKQLAKDYE